MRYYYLVIIAFTLSLLVACQEEPSASADSAMPDTVATIRVHKSSVGEKLFKQYCISCHFADERKSTGPGLRCATQSMPKGDWKYNFVQNPSRMIASGDPYAIKIYSEHTSVMPSFSLSNAEIDAIFEWIDSEYPCKRK